MLRRFRKGALPIVCAVVWAAGWAMPARAAEDAVAWPTFLRLGPGALYRAVGELPRGTVVDVLGCDEGWCRARLGRVVGYVRRAALDPGEFAGSRPGSGQECFISRSAGNGGGEAFRYCPR